MAGIYIHIPFCKKKCHYCNFYSTPSTKYRDELISTLHKELVLQKNFLNEAVGTIYFGGGTPSLLTTDEIKNLLETIAENYSLTSDAEITLEVNPDDINSQKIRELKTTDVNRISIGIQSFFKQDLEYLNRIHSPEQAEYAIKAFQDAGFSNISIDLIYGIPTLGLEHWKENLARAVEMQLPHISAYAITVEPNTNLEVLIRHEKRQPVSEAETATQFRFVMDYLKEHKYLHYEISNFCLPGMESRHNKAYWENIPYLGIGPSAHSFDKTRRLWNCSNLEKYISDINAEKISSETEILSANQKYNEFIMMYFRTNRGVSTEQLKIIFGEEYLLYFQKVLKTYEKKKLFTFSDSTISLNDEGKLFVDNIIADFFIVV